MNSVIQKEVLKRLLKYAIMFVVVAYSIHSIPSKKISNIILISIMASTTFAIFDMVSPTICLKHQD